MSRKTFAKTIINEIMKIRIESNLIG